MKGAGMQLTEKETAKFIVHHKLTEDKLLRLEKGIRKIGFKTSGRKIIVALIASVAGALILALVLDGGLRFTAMGFGLVCLVALLFCLYTMISGWRNAKKDIHNNFMLKSDGGYDWEYHFFDQYYEAIGKNEASRINYTYVGRLMDFSGMIVFVERGNVVRFFMKEDTEDGKGDLLAEFLESKTGLKIELIRV